MANSSRNERIFSRVRGIPKGFVRTYGDVDPLAPRLVGRILSQTQLSLVYQQLAGRAAQAIYTRVRATVGPTLTPQSLAAASDERLRRAGLSANKLASLRDLAAKVSEAPSRSHGRQSAATTS